MLLRSLTFFFRLGIPFISYIDHFLLVINLIYFCLINQYAGAYRYREKLGIFRKMGKNMLPGKNCVRIS